jgi:catechol 2,3-dioxygenase-like lactoylglutathione lyase family enzyme
MDAESLHHVTLPVTDLERSKAFYRDIMRLEEIERPPFNHPGAWFGIGPGHLHLTVIDDPTLRDGKELDSSDVHFAVRVRSYREALDFLRSKGYAEDGAGLRRMKVSPHATAGFPQLYILDPDRHVIEINAAQLD